MEATASVQSKAERGFKYALLAPAVIWVIGLTFFPILAAIHYSFANYVLGEGITGYVGFDNYARLLTDSGFWYAIFITVLELGMGDLIVVMSKGLVQQVGTPKELYNAPINRYVAGFIGSPSMNFLRGQVGADGTVSAGENFRLLLSKERSAAALQKGINVCIGVRPEHLVIERNPESATRNVIKGVVEVVEPQGATSILQINIGEEKKIIAQINEQWGRVAGEKLTLTVASELIHLFDPNTEERIR